MSATNGRYVVFALAEGAAIADCVIAGTWQTEALAASFAEAICNSYPFISTMVVDLSPKRVRMFEADLEFYNSPVTIDQPRARRTINFSGEAWADGDNDPADSTGP